MVNPVRAIRMELGISQGDLAILAAEWGPTISLIERGERKPTKRLLETLAELGFNIAEIQRKHADFVTWKRERISQELQLASEKKCRSWRQRQAD